MTIIAESICSPQPLLPKMPPLPTTAHESHGAFLNGVSYEHMYTQFKKYYPFGSLLLNWTYVFVLCIYTKIGNLYVYYNTYLCIRILRENRKF